MKNLNSISYEQYLKITTELLELSKKSLDVARQIYLDTIKLLIISSVGSIPLIGIFISIKNVSEVKWFISASLITLIASIGFGIISLIRHAIFFKAESNYCFKEIQTAYQKYNENEFQSWMNNHKNIFVNQRHFVKGLEYIWNILQLIFFIFGILLLFISLIIVVF